MQISIDAQVEEKMNRLLYALLAGGYYQSEQAALTYAQKIINFIYSIPSRAARKTKDARHGEFYATFKPNRRTTWYILFDVEDDVYRVRNVINNHTKDYPLIIGKLK